MYEVLFITAAGTRKRVHGFPLFGGALWAAAELLTPGMRSEVHDQLTGCTVKFFGYAPVEEPEWPQPFGPEPAVSVSILDWDGDLVFDFNAETGSEAARWARRILGL